MDRLNQEDTKDEGFKLRLFKNTKARGGLGWDIIRLVAKKYYKYLQEVGYIDMLAHCTVQNAIYC